MVWYGMVSTHLIGTWSLAQQMIETQEDEDHDALQDNQYLHGGRRQPGEQQAGKRQHTQKEDDSGSNTHVGHIARTGRRKAIAVIAKVQRTCQTRDRMRKAPRMNRAWLKYKAAP